MTDLDAFLPNIMPYAPGCSEPTAFAAIIKATQDFCERTRLWRDEDTFSITPTSCNVVCVPAGADLFEIEYASFNGTPLTPISISDLDEKKPGWRNDDGTSSAAQWITQTEPGSVMVVPKTSGTLKLAVFLRPAEDAEQLPDFIASLYRRVIADGALAEILMTPNQPFTAPDRAQFYSARFEAKLNELFNRTIKGQQRSAPRVRARFF